MRLPDPSAEEPTSIPKELEQLKSKAAGDPELREAVQKIRHRAFTFYSALAFAGIGYILFCLVFFGIFTPAKELTDHNYLIQLGILALIPSAIFLTLIKEKPSHEIESPLLVVGKELVEIMKTWLSSKGK